MIPVSSEPSMRHRVAADVSKTNVFLSLPARMSVTMRGR